MTRNGYACYRCPDRKRPFVDQNCPAGGLIVDRLKIGECPRGLFAVTDIMDPREKLTAEAAFGCKGCGQ
jgi:hypothetical protein